jgi:hypothetical protein
MAETITYGDFDWHRPKLGRAIYRLDRIKHAVAHGHDLGSIRTIFAIPALTARAWLLMPE